MRQGHGQVEFLGRGGESGREERRDPRHEQNEHRVQQQQHDQQYAHHFAREGNGGGAAFSGENARKTRNKGDVKGAFGKQAAEEIRQFEGDKKRVRQPAGADEVGHDNVAHEAADARKQGKKSDDGR